MRDKPAFEIRSKGSEFKIYADGRVEGFGDGTVFITNRIPALIAQARAAERTLITMADANNQDKTDE